MAAFLKAQRYTNRKTPAQLLERLRSAPTGRAGEIETRTRRQIVLHLVRTLQVMVGQIRQLEGEIAQALRAHPDGEIFQSFFRLPDSVICAATLSSEIGDSRHRYFPPRRDRGRRRPSTGRGRIGQTQEREVPVGMQQVTTQGV
jgi:hypothetical protein